jgi:hypothetical protein
LSLVVFVVEALTKTGLRLEGCIHPLEVTEHLKSRLSRAMTLQRDLCLSRRIEG